MIKVLENQCKIMLPLFGAAHAAPSSGTTILYWFMSQKTLLNPPVNSKIEGLFKAFEYFLSTFQGKFYFQDSPVNSSVFQACANPGTGMCNQFLSESLWFCTEELSSLKAREMNIYMHITEENLFM